MQISKLFSSWGIPDSVKNSITFHFFMEHHAFDSYQHIAFTPNNLLFMKDN